MLGLVPGVIALVGLNQHRVVHVRAERSLIPAASAAASMVFASISFFLSRLTCASVTIELLGAPAPVRSPQLPSFSRAVSTTSNRQK